CPLVFFFFQAEDGIRDFHVTGVQTCALPISYAKLIILTALVLNFTGFVLIWALESTNPLTLGMLDWPEQLKAAWMQSVSLRTARSEERRVGKEWRCRGGPKPEHK